MRSSIFFWLLILSAATYASENFKCITKDAVSLEADGSFQKSSFTEIFIDQEFIVERETGRMIGLMNNHEQGAKPKVYDYEPHENGYKAITIYPNETVAYLFIAEYVPEKIKPFTYTPPVGNGTIISGQCSYY